MALGWMLVLSTVVRVMPLPQLPGRPPASHLCIENLPPTPPPPVKATPMYTVTVPAPTVAWTRA